MEGEIVVITIKRLPIVNGVVASRHECPGEVIRRYELPRWLYDTSITMNRIDWITARFKYFNPRYKIERSWSSYTPQGPGHLVRSVAAHKAQVTKVRFALESYKEAWQPDLLMTSIDDDPYWQRGLAKLREAEQRLADAQKKLDQYNDNISLTD